MTILSVRKCLLVQFKDDYTQKVYKLFLNLTNDCPKSRLFVGSFFFQSKILFQMFINNFAIPAFRPESTIDDSISFILVWVLLKMQNELILIA